LREIRDFYESRSTGLGAEFIAAFDQQVCKIAAMPERWMITRGDTRRALMRRFPYVIYFRIVRGDTIRITVVKHTRRHPAFGMERK
jgi:toxin ParE1/3/4